MIAQLVDWARRRPVAFAVLVSALFLPFKLFGLEVGYLNIHAARDWERGWQMFHLERGWWHGPELLFGGAIPGWFFNLLTGLFQIPHRNPYFAAAGPPLLFCISIGFLYDALRRTWGHRVALLATLAYGTFPLGTLALRYLWNPSYLFLFTALASWCVVRALSENRPAFLAGGMLSLLLASQIHLSVYSTVIAFMLAMLWWRRFPGWKAVLLALATEALFIAPYFIDQAVRNWPDGAARHLNELDERTRVGRIKVNPLFWAPFRVQSLVPAPNWDQVYPFSYYDRFYKQSAAGRALGWGCCALSFLLAAVMAAGVVSRWLARGQPPWAAALVAYSVLVVLVVGLPTLLWNPQLGRGGDVHVPVRYFFALWPSQFVLLAAGLHALHRHRAAWLSAIGVVVLQAGLCGAFTILFHLEAQRTGLPFRYLFNDPWPVHALRDKMAVANHLARKYGVTEELFLRRVHTQDEVLQIPEESLDFEMRAAVENAGTMPRADETLFYYIFKPEDASRLVGEWDKVEVSTFGSLGLLVYRPRHPGGEMQVDPPISWWWY